ncbi:MAG: hypothetical protein ACTHMV_17800 [Chitinophagaceae bacterium]
MKLIKFFAAGLLMAALFTACSKDKDTPAPPAFNIVGRWEGKLGTGSSIPTGFFGLDVKANGKLDRINDEGEISGSGTWTVNGNTFTGHYVSNSNGVSIDVIATVDKLSNKLTGGTWENSGNNSGTWYANKK